jgi:hypothetical protein
VYNDIETPEKVKRNEITSELHSRVSSLILEQDEATFL